MELHHADTDRAIEQPASLVSLLTESLFTAATTLRSRYLAIFELHLEATRRPALASALEGLQDTAVQITAGQHDKLGLNTPRATIHALITSYGGALFSLVTSPRGSISKDIVQDIVQAIVDGCGIGEENPGRCE